MTDEFEDYVAVNREVMAAIEAKADRCVNAEHYTAEMALNDLQDIRAIIAKAGLRADMIARADADAAALVQAFNAWTPPLAPQREGE